MPDYELTEEAENDLLHIARYTVKRWGIDQARRYDGLLEDHFQALSRGTITDIRKVFDHREDYLSSRCEHHYVFHLERADQKPLILAIFHENMELLVKLRERLSNAPLHQGD